MSKYDVTRSEEIRCRNKAFNLLLCQEQRELFDSLNDQGGGNFIIVPTLLALSLAAAESSSTLRGMKRAMELIFIAAGLSLDSGLVDAINEMVASKTKAEMEDFAEEARDRVWVAELFGVSDDEVEQMRDDLRVAQVVLEAMTND